jgi:hypothetical protein
LDRQMTRQPYYPRSLALMSLPSCVPEDMGATVNWLLTSQHADLPADDLKVDKSYFSTVLEKIR